MKPSQLASQLRRIAAAIDNSKKPDRTLVARDLKKVLAAVTKKATGGTFSPRPDDSVIVTPLDGNKFRVEGVLSDLSGGGTLAGIAVTHEGGALEFQSDDGSELEESAYETLVDIMGDANPNWM